MTSYQLLAIGLTVLVIACWIAWSSGRKGQYLESVAGLKVAAAALAAIPLPAIALFRLSEGRWWTVAAVVVVAGILPVICYQKGSDRYWYR
jgi:hypothetical protein